MGALQRQTERALRRLSIDNMKIQVRMLEQLIAEEERLLSGVECQESECGCNGRSDLMVTDN